MYRSRGNRILIFGLTYTELHFIQIARNIHSRFKRQRRLQDGDVIVKSSYLILAHLQQQLYNGLSLPERIDGHITVVYRHIDRDTIEYILFFILKHQHL